ncbi:MAG: hypothetical protein FJY85_14940 [Deltaproteobacteria bacterium]|nr:hypothetical protein [Deltaproteobacteria bacterium]
MRDQLRPFVPESPEDPRYEVSTWIPLQKSALGIPPIGPRFYFIRASRIHHPLHGAVRHLRRIIDDDATSTVFIGSSGDEGAREELVSWLSADPQPESEGWIYQKIYRDLLPELEVLAVYTDSIKLALKEERKWIWNYIMTFGEPPILNRRIDWAGFVREGLHLRCCKNHRWWPPPFYVEGEGTLARCRERSQV